jgi:hypothetical protein
MTDARVAARTRILEAHGATPSTIEELLAYSAKPFEEPACPTFPLADEPHVDVWRSYAADATRDGAWESLRRHFVQLRVPIRAGVSQEPAYQAATRRGQSAAADDEFAPGLALARPDGLHLSIQATIAGGVPILVADDRRDFVAMVQAFSERNEPVDVPPSMGACIVNGLNNWDRVAAYREQWERANPEDADTSWGDEFKRFAARKELYQDRFIILSRGPYSAIAARDIGLADDDWLARSLVVRREHECTHYFTYRVFRSMRNNVFDELIADFVGLVRAFDGYRGDLARRFLGLEAFPMIRPGSRLEVYRSGLSDAALPTIGSLAVAAATNLQTLSDGHATVVRDLTSLARLTYALSLLTLEELASEEMPQLVEARMA